MGGCFCTAPASASTGQGEVGGGRRKGSPARECVPAVKWGGSGRVGQTKGDRPLRAEGDGAGGGIRGLSFGS